MRTTGKNLSTSYPDSKERRKKENATNTFTRAELPLRCEFLSCGRGVRERKRKRMSSTDVNSLPVLKQRFTLDELEKIWAASHAVRGWVGNIVQLLEQAVLRVDEPNIAELHVTRVVYGSSVSQRGELLDVQTLVGTRHGVSMSKLMVVQQRESWRLFTFTCMIGIDLILSAVNSTYISDGEI